MLYVLCKVAIINGYPWINTCHFVQYSTHHVNIYMYGYINIIYGGRQSRPILHMEHRSFISDHSSFLWGMQGGLLDPIHSHTMNIVGTYYLMLTYNYLVNVGKIWQTQNLSTWIYMDWIRSLKSIQITIYIYIYILYLSICISIYLSIHLSIYLSICTICVHARRRCVYIYIYVYIYRQIQIYVYVYIYICLCVYLHIYIHMYICV